LKILFLSYYFYPDLSAGSFRSKALVDALIENGGPDIHVTVITTFPNRYDSYREGVDISASSNQLDIIRVPVPQHEGKIFRQIKGFILYYCAVIKLAKTKKYNLVFATSSRLMTAFLGARVSKMLNVSLYLDIRDIFPDTIKHLFSDRIGYIVSLIFSNIERWTIKSAKHINLVSQGFEGYFLNISQKLHFSFYTNGIDDEFIGFQSNADKKKPELNEKIVLYAGNIGFGQGLHLILPKLAQKTAGRFRFRVIGDGGMLSDLKNEISSLGISNIEIVKPITRDKLSAEYANADVLILHLNKLPAFEKVLPSKIFEYAAMGKPILAGVTGYAAKFLQDELVDGIMIFEPCDIEAAALGLDNQKFMPISRENFIEKYKRTKIMSALALDILSYADK